MFLWLLIVVAVSSKDPVGHFLQRASNEPRITCRWIVEANQGVTPLSGSWYDKLCHKIWLSSQHNHHCAGEKYRANRL